MGKSSIHIRPVTSGSERHNNRERKLNYVREDLQHLNSSFKVQGIAETRKFIEENVKEKTGRKMQAKATPIREGVLLIDEKHTADDLKKLAGKIEERFGIKTIQGYCHKDEGHYDKVTNEWKSNYHAHMVFDWTDHSSGKSIKMSREDMSELQTIVAEELGLERGQKSTKKHIEATRYKAIKEEQDLEKVYGVKNVLPKALNTINKAKTLEREIEPLRTTKEELTQQVAGLRFTAAEVAKQTEQEKERVKVAAEEVKKLSSTQKHLQEQTGMHRVNLKYLKEKTEKKREELQELEKQKEQEKERQRSRGMGRSRGR